VLGLHVDRHDPQPGHRGEQCREAGADPRIRRRRPHHQPEQQLAVGRLGEQDVLELAGPCRDVVRRQAGVSDPVGDAVQGRGEAGRVQAAVTQVDAGQRVAVQDPQGRRLDGAADRHLGLVAEAGPDPGDGRKPDRRTDQGPRVLFLVGQLSSAWDLQQGAGAAAEGVVVVAVDLEARR
jgi:hypothetical protein